jgi:hypothetical protein
VVAKKQKNDTIVVKEKTRIVANKYSS